MIEFNFQSTIHYKNPFKNITLNVVFTAPNGTQMAVPAFWAGADRWCVRYASAIKGTHTFLTQCSDTNNAGLHQQSGQVALKPYVGDNPLVKHGGLRISDDQRHFCHTDGTPFFWLGDTWWMALCKRLKWPEDFKTLVQNRKQHGFNVIQFVAGFYPDMAPFDERGRSENGFCWDEALTTVNPAFFDEADQKIAYLVEEGLTPCIVGAWGYYLPHIGVENMQLHWRYLMARWGAYPVVWVAAGEQTMPWYLESPKEKVRLQALQKKGWSEVLACMRNMNAFSRLITTHPVTSARASVNAAHLLDFEMQQTNHQLPTYHHAQCATQGWKMHPKTPVISAEARYEALEITPPVTTQHIREAFWAHTLNSGCAGHTYGANGIWQVNGDDAPFGCSASGLHWGSLPWRKAMHLSGAQQLSAAKAFLMTLPWHTFEALPLKNNLLYTFYSRYSLLKKILDHVSRFGMDIFTTMLTPAPVAACIGKQKNIALFYTVTKKAFKINLKDFPAPVFIYWVDPTNGLKTRQSSESISPKGFYRVQATKKNAANENDWLILISTKKLL